MDFVLTKNKNDNNNFDALNQFFKIKLYESHWQSTYDIQTKKKTEHNTQNRKQKRNENNCQNTKSKMTTKKKKIAGKNVKYN